MKPTIWIFSIEPIESRYTAQWHNHIPLLLANNIFEFNVIQIDGIQNNSQVTTGAFLNFSDTNYWKSSQLCKFLEHYNNGEVSPNDQILITDAWNPIVVQLRYMNDLLGFNWKLHGLWHAGSYDSEDFLGRLIGDKPWVRHAELSMVNSYDYNYFATKFHIELFQKTYLDIDTTKLVLSGWPMEYMYEILNPYLDIPKRDLIVFPHRIAPEKQVDIFRDIAKTLPQYEFIVCQDQKLSKHEYHSLLGASKMIFSANLQETLGISTCSEGPLLNAIPFAPDRLSYSEIFEEYQDFLYPSEWTLDWSRYITNKELIVNRIIDIMENYDNILNKVHDYNLKVHNTYFSSHNLINTLSLK